MTLKSGTMLGPFEILSLIGTGGMGEVYKASDTHRPWWENFSRFSVPRGGAGIEGTLHDQETTQLHFENDLLAH